MRASVPSTAVGRTEGCKYLFDLAQIRNTNKLQITYMI
jgi:hypothetical protein